MDIDIEELTASMVREYLVTKHLNESFYAFQEEQPKRTEAFNKRNIICKTLHVEKLFSQYKDYKTQTPSILEAIIAGLVTRNNDEELLNRSLPVDKALKGILMKESPKLRSSNSKKNHLHFSDEYMNSPFAQGFESGVKYSACNCNDLSLGETAMEVNNLSDEISFDKCTQQKSKRSAKSPPEQEEMTLDDIEDNDYSNFSSPMCPALGYDKQLPAPITRAKAKELRSLVFGSTTKNFNQEWKTQNFEFSPHPDIGYGLLQKKAGPCGIIACVQSYIIKELLFPDTGDALGLKPKRADLDYVLRVSLLKILWKVGQRKKAILAIFNGRQVAAGASDKNPESLLLLECRSFEQLDYYIFKYLDTFKRDDRGGCISLLYSAILSRGIENVRSDMDEPTSHLIGVHGYCTLEMVNLFLIGRARSNVFDNEIKLDSGGGQLSLLRGISSQSEIGFLSLFEHYNSFTVGKHMKNPVYPIWVVCSESHFTVLFSQNKALVGIVSLQPKLFDLMYYDSLGNNDCEIKLQLDLSVDYMQDVEDDAIPPLEHCIRTKWPGATIEWRGCEPLL